MRDKKYIYIEQARKNWVLIARDRQREGEPESAKQAKECGEEPEVKNKQKLKNTRLKTGGVQELN